MNELQFPVTVEAFTAIQERLSGRPLGINERSLLPLTVEWINEAYTSGLQGVSSWPETVEQITEAGIDLSKPVAMQFFSALVHWRKRAYEAGRATA